MIVIEFMYKGTIVINVYIKKNSEGEDSSSTRQNNTKS